MPKYIFFSFVFFSTIIYAQKSSSLWDMRIDSLRMIYNQSIEIAETITSNDTEDSLMVKIVVRMLRSENSYKQKWDSISNFLSCMTTPDNRCKIISWKFPIPSAPNLFSYRGVIQMNDKQNTLIPLFDGYAFSEDRTNVDGYNNPTHWFGATYYTILQLEKNEPVYTLFGLRQDDIFSDKKIVETLRINPDNSIALGGTFQLNGIDTSIYSNGNERFVFGFKKGIATTFLYEKDLKRIVFDQLTPIADALKSQNKPISGIAGINNIVVPDGHYLGLKYAGKSTWFFVGSIVNLMKMKE